MGTQNEEHIEYVQAKNDPVWVTQVVDSAFSVLHSLLPLEIDGEIFQSVMEATIRCIRDTRKECLLKLNYRDPTMVETYFGMSNRTTMPEWREIVTLRKQMFPDTTDDIQTGFVGEVENRHERITQLMTEYLRRKNMDLNALALAHNLAVVNDMKRTLLESTIPTKVRIAVGSILSANTGKNNPEEDNESYEKPVRSGITNAADNGQILHAIDTDARDATSIPRKGERRVEFWGPDGKEVVFRKITEEN